MSSTPTGKTLTGELGWHAASIVTSLRRRRRPVFEKRFHNLYLVDLKVSVDARDDAA